MRSTKDDKQTGTGSTVRQPANNPRRRAGKLARFKEMPLDIVFEIFSHLNPADLLRLARVSKRFRAILMTRANQHLWVAARKNLPLLPDPPAWVSELRYAAFLFGNTCFECGKRAGKVSHSMAFRYCASCWKENVQSGYELTNHEDDQHPWSELLPLIPCQRSVHSLHDAFHVGSFHEIVEKYTSLQSDPKAKEAYIEERKKHIAEAHAFAQGFDPWYDELRRERKIIYDRRQERIEERLISMGYTKADFPASLFSGNTRKWIILLRQSKELTQTEWDRVLPRAEALIANEKKYHQSQQPRRW